MAELRASLARSALADSAGGMSIFLSIFLDRFLDDVDVDVAGLLDLGCC